MITFIVTMLIVILVYCVALWIVGIIDNSDEYTVMSLRTFCRLMKRNKVFDVDTLTGIGYYTDGGYRDWVMPRWTWYPVFMLAIIYCAVHKEVI